MEERVAEHWTAWANGFCARSCYCDRSKRSLNLQDDKILGLGLMWHRSMVWWWDWWDLVQLTSKASLRIHQLDA